MDNEEARKVMNDIIEGSDKINKMKKEIDLIVGALAGFVKDELGGLEEGAMFYRNLLYGRYLWRIKKSADILEINFLLFCDNPNMDPKVIYSSGSANNIKLEHVSTVYHALPDFIILMDEKFPQLAEHWRPLTQVSGD